MYSSLLQRPTLVLHFHPPYAEYREKSTTQASTNWIVYDETNVFNYDYVRTRVKCYEDETGNNLTMIQTNTHGRAGTNTLSRVLGNSRDGTKTATSGTVRSTELKYNTDPLSEDDSMTRSGTREEVLGGETRGLAANSPSSDTHTIRKEKRENRPQVNTTLNGTDWKRPRPDDTKVAVETDNTVSTPVSYTHLTLPTTPYV